MSDSDIARRNVHLVLEAKGSDGAIIRLLRSLLKRLGRDHDVRCRSATMNGADVTPPGEDGSKG